MSKYNYSTPENAILSLESAYDNEDIESVLESKDFIGEASVILKNMGNFFDEEILKETAELLRLSLIENIQNNGFPSFKGAKREFSTRKYLYDNIYVLLEKLKYDDKLYINKVSVSNNNGNWKVVMVEDYEEDLPT